MVNKRLLQLIAFYDNEYGYCCRVLDLLEYLTKKMPQSTPSK
jgi:glyceraldehyde-3-phosphate dehydrogenase/erythrose-4-phosphate dehydrogenase